MMIVSPSGGGKTSTVIFPSCFNIQSSMIINDPSGEISKSKNYLISRGFDVITLNFGDKENSVYFNPLHRIKSNADVNKVARMLVQATTKNGEMDFWANKSVELIGMIINYLLATAPEINQNLANVFKILEVLQGSPEKIDALFADNAPEHLWQKYKSLIGNSDNTRASIVSSAQASLSFIGDDPTLCDITSTDTINFSDFRKEKTVLFLRCPLGDVDYYSTIQSIFFEQFFSYVFSELPKDDDDHIFVLIDELSSLHLPNLSNIISNCRKFRTPFLGVLQAEAQLANNYGEYNAKTILNNAGVKVYFTGLSEESKHLEKTLGQYTYEDEKGNKRTRNLKTADETRTMPKDRVIIIPSGLRPIYAKIKPHYKQPRLMNYLNMELPEDYVTEKIEYTVQYLDLENKNIEPQNAENEVSKPI
jgi:type IV secretion system protein VirD4